jgi:hypothetical protein
MSDDLLLHYNRELLNIRRKRPSRRKIRTRPASLSEDAVEDPHVGRSSRSPIDRGVRQKLDDDFPNDRRFGGIPIRISTSRSPQCPSWMTRSQTCPARIWCHTILTPSRWKAALPLSHRLRRLLHPVVVR